jgi:AIG2-like family.
VRRWAVRAFVYRRQVIAIEGYVFISENLAAHWAALDEFEGAEYQRVAVDVQLEGGEWMQSEIYA